MKVLRFQGRSCLAEVSLIGSLRNVIKVLQIYMLSSALLIVTLCILDSKIPLASSCIDLHVVADSKVSPLYFSLATRPIISSAFAI